MQTTYLILGALTFWTLVGTALLVGSVAIAEWHKGRTRHQIDTVADPFTERETRNIVRRYRERSIG